MKVGWSSSRRDLLTRALSSVTNYVYHTITSSICFSSFYVGLLWSSDDHHLNHRLRLLPLLLHQITNRPPSATPSVVLSPGMEKENCNLRSKRIHNLHPKIIKQQHQKTGKQCSLPVFSCFSCLSHVNSHLWSGDGYLDRRDTHEIMNGRTFTYAARRETDEVR